MKTIQNDRLKDIKHLPRIGELFENRFIILTIEDTHQHTNFATPLIEAFDIENGVYVEGKVWLSYINRISEIQWFIKTQNETYQRIDLSYARP